MKPDDLRIPNAFEEAKKAGLRYTIDEIDLRDAHPNTAVLELTGKGGRALTVQASSLGGGRIMVNKLDGIEVNFTGESNTLVVRNQDELGSVAAVTSILNQLHVNVANTATSAAATRSWSSRPTSTSSPSRWSSSPSCPVFWA